MSAPTLAFKGVAVDEGTDSQVVDINETEGLVTAVVSVTGTKDDVDDVIMPGAYAETLSKRMPKVCWHHDWAKPIGRVLHIEELMPGDSRLPTKQRNGQPWPKEAGALVATMQFNLKSERGREAFEAVRFYSESGECEWSIGYQVPAGKAHRDKQGVRFIKAIDLFELSYVLFGAHNMTGTLTLKAAVLVMSRHAAATKAAGTDVVIRREEFEQALKALKPKDDEQDQPADQTDQTEPPTGDVPPANDAPPAADTVPPVPPVPPTPDAAAVPPADGSDPGDPIEDDGAQEQEVLLFDNDPGIPDGEAGDAGDGAAPPENEPATDTPDDTEPDDDEPKKKPASKALDAAHLEMRLVAADPWYAARYGEGKAAVEAKRKLNTEQRRKKPTLPGSDTAWPIGDRTDLEAAIRSFGRAKPSERDKVKAWITRRARELGATDAIPDAWKKKGGKSQSLADYLVASLNEAYSTPLDAKLFGFELTPLGEIKDTRPGDQSRGARELIHWYERGEGAAKIRWGEPGDFMRCVRIAEKHMTPEQAKGFCSNRHLGALGVRPGQEKAYGSDSADVDPADMAPAGRMANEDEPEHSGVMIAVYPSEDVAKQIAVRGGEDPEELHVTLAYLGDVSDDIGNGLSLGDATPQLIAAAQIAAATNQPLTGTIGGIGKFPDSGDGVPIWAPVDVVGLSALREAVVTALTDAQLPVQTDHGFTPHMTLGWNLDMNLIPPVDDVTVTFDKLVVAVGDERTEVPIGGDADIPSSGAPVAGAAPLNPPLPDQEKAAAYDPRIETGPDAGYRPAVAAQRKAFPYIEGTFEERQQMLTQALSEALLPEGEDDNGRPLADRQGLNIEGTWEDRVVCTVHDWSDPASGSPGRQSWEVQYTVNDDGTVSLGEPEKVKLTVTAVDEDGEELADIPVGDMLPLAEMVDTVTSGIKAVTGGVETKAGRVLSAANAQRLRSAVEHLISVLAAAGIEIGDPTASTGGATPPNVDTETTAPSARDGATKGLTPADVAATLADLEAALEN